MSSDFADLDYILDILRTGRCADLEELAQIVDGFPDGTDAVVGRRWIINAIDAGAPRDTIAWMLSKGIAVRFCDEEGYTVLHACIERSRREDRYLIMADLIAAGADVDLKGINDWTPLHAAVWRGDLGALRLLLEAGADRTIRTKIDHCRSAEEDATQMGYAAAIEMFRTIPQRKKLARER